ncbi:hypothetical protein ACFXG4_41215 [Nocardia sp. NPDC059246]|uniref:hypothetical protein n=1 Tax=unclassified Nocardia TaxID=2637762 RepID=UPI0036737416
MTESTAFLDAIATLDYTFTHDRRAARRGFTDALDLATPADHAFLDGLIDTFTLYPFHTALKRLAAQYDHEPHNRQRLAKLVPDTDPGLYIRDRADRLALIEQRAKQNNTTVDDEYFPLHTDLVTAELPPLPMRQWRNPPARTYLAPRKDTDKSRNTSAKMLKRIQQRTKRRPAEHEPKLVTEYAAETLYTDTMAADIATAQAAETRAVERGLMKPPSTPSTTTRAVGAAQPVPAADARAQWDFTYVAYVAEQHQHARALAGKRPVSDNSAVTASIRRTTLYGYGDRRSAIPFQGNGLDYDQEALTIVLGWRCVSCFVERAETDRRILHARNGQLRSDDGLCDYCRDDQRPGLPPLPAGFNARDLATAYCRFFAATYPAAARPLLTEVRNRAPRWLSGLIDEFLTTSCLPAATTAAHQPEPATPTARPTRQRGPVHGAGQHTGRCDACTRITVIADDSICSSCRVWLGLEVPTPRHRAA